MIMRDADTINDKMKETKVPVNTDVSTIRLNKYLSDNGICSRREADKLIEDGRVSVDGKIALIGEKITNGQAVKVNGKPVMVMNKNILIAFNKPKGIVCTTAKQEKDNIIDFINYPDRIIYVGRLDKESEGLILLTNNGELANEIMRARNYHEKEYIVTVDKPIDQDFITKMENGVPILDTITRKCKVEKVGSQKFKIVITQGLNRQIRRMCEYLGYRVYHLKRTRIMHIKLGDLKTGTYRNLTKEETDLLYKSIEKDDINTGR